jgi:hypothetical protein
MTVNEIFERAIALIDRITDAGVVDTTNTADYKARTPFLVNLFQMELIKSGDLFTKYPIAYKPFTNILLGGDHFEVDEHLLTDIPIESADGDVAKLYYFESDGASGSVLIQDYTSSWNTLATITLANTGYGFMPYKALITPTSGATKSRIVFSGNYYYRFRNVAMHAETLSNINRFHDYAPRVKVAMPSTCHSIKDVIFKYYKDGYDVSPRYEIERNGNLWEILFDRNFEGEMLVTYVPNPTKITTADLSESLTVDDFSADIIAYMLAEAFMNVEQNDYLAGLFKNKYQQLIAESNYKKPKPVVKIINKYGSV